MSSIQVPQTATVSDHGLAIIGPNGKTVGGIFEWNENQAETVTPLYEFGAVTVGQDDVLAARGEPYENMPGNSTGMSITIGRYDIYLDRFVEAFGTRKLEMLSRQHKPVDVRAVLQQPDGSLLFTKKFYGFWFTSLGTAHSATGDRVVRIQAAASFTRIREL